MSDESTALDALKVILADLNPAPEPAPLKVWVYPADHELITLARLPVVIISKVINRSIPWSRSTHSRGRHTWPCEILAFLANGPIIDDKMAAQLESKADPWPAALSALLWQNSRLNDTATSIGGDDALFTYQVGHIHFWSNICFGIRFELLITQMVTQAQAR